MVNYIVTGAEVSDGYPVVWIVGKAISLEEAYEIVEDAEKQYLESNGKSAEEVGIEYEVHKI